VIKNFLELVRIDTGIRVPRSMVVGVPNWDIFKGPREITRSKRKPKPIEQEIVEEGSQAQPGNRSDVADKTEQVNSGAEILATEEHEVVTDEQLTSIAQRKAVQKERRSKKRLDRPADAEEDQNVRAAKKKKTVVSKRKAADTSKGNSSKPNTDSTSNAQTSKQPSPIDFTKPLSVVLPNVLKTGPDRPVRPVQPGTGPSTGPEGHAEPLVRKTGKKPEKSD
jgi:hypothetical protein